MRWTTPRSAIPVWSYLATPATRFVQRVNPAYKKAKTVYPWMPQGRVALAEAGVTAINLLCTDHGWLGGVRL